MKDVLNFLFEIGQLNRVKRSGYWMAKIANPNSVSEHTFRAAVVAYVLAGLEGANPEKTALMALFHDIHESRINDLHKVGQRYIDFRAAEKKVFDDQMKLLPDKTAKMLIGMRRELENDKSKEAIVARDADLIEDALQSKEYLDIGYKDVHDWINNVRKTIRTESAKKLLDLIEKTDSNCWWQNLKKIER